LKYFKQLCEIGSFVTKIEVIGSRYDVVEFHHCILFSAAEKRQVRPRNFPPPQLMSLDSRALRGADVSAPHYPPIRKQILRMRISCRAERSGVERILIINPSLRSGADIRKLLKSIENRVFKGLYMFNI